MSSSVISTSSSLIEQSTSTSAWQRPFVDAFKLVGCRNGSFQNIQKEGSVQETMDKAIGKRVIQVSGTISSNNYVKIPSASNACLGLTGPFLYLQVKPILPKVFSIVVEVLSQDNLPSRITLSNLFRSAKRKGNVVQIPLKISNDWHTLALDLPEILATYQDNIHTDLYWCVKSITFCSTLLVKGAYTSDALYDHHENSFAIAFPKEVQLSKILKEEIEWIPGPPKASLDFEPCLIVPKSCIIANKNDFPQTRPQDKDSVVLSRSSILATADLENRPINIPGLSTKREIEVTPSCATVEKMKSKPKTTTVTSTAASSCFSTASFPDPVMSLRTLVGYTSCGAKPLWLRDGKHVIYASGKNIIITTSSNLKQNQTILVGHTDVVTSLALSCDGTLLASAQAGKYPLIRIWDVQNATQIAVVAAAPGGGLRSLDFSDDGLYMCGIGRDEHYRSQLYVWQIFGNISNIKLQLYAKYNTEIDTARIRFSPYNSSHLVSCGRENIRFWRVKEGQISGCPATLNELCRQAVFTDLDFEIAGLPNESLSEKRVFVATSEGTVCVVNFESRLVQSVFRVHDARISSIIVNEGFCVTGSEDCHIRIWPLEFNDFFLEERHNAPVAAIAVSPDGLELLTGTEANTLSILNISSQQVTTSLHSHSDFITNVAFRPHTNHADQEIVTSSADGVMCIWSIPSCEKLYTFSVPDDQCTVLMYHPQRNVILCGFTSGYFRVFDIQQGMFGAQHKQHTGTLLDLAADAVQTISLGIDKQMCIYDASFVPQHMISLSTLTTTPERFGVIATGSASHLQLSVYSGKTMLSIISPHNPSEIIICVRDHAQMFHQAHTVTIPENSRNSGQRAYFTSISVTPKGQDLFATTSDNRILKYRFLFSVSQGYTTNLVRDTHSGHPESLHSLTLSPVMSSFMATTGNDCFIRIRDNRASTGRPSIQRFSGHHQPKIATSFSPDCQYFVSVGEHIMVWKFHGTDIQRDEASMEPPQVVEDEEAEEIPPELTVVPMECRPLPKKHPKPIRNDARTPMEKQSLECADHDMRVLGFNVRGRNCVAWCPHTGFFAYASGRRVVVEDLTLQSQTVYDMHIANIGVLALSSDGSKMASAGDSLELSPQGSSHACIVLWNIHEDHTLEGHILPPGHCGGGIQSMSFSKDHAILVSLGNCQDLSICVWDVNSMTLTAKTGLAPETVCHDIAFSGKHIITVGSKSTLSLWTPEETSLKPESIAVRASQSAHATCVASAPSWLVRAHGVNDVIAIGDSEGYVSIVTLPQLSVIATWKAAAAEIEYINWHGKTLACALGSGTLQLWDVVETYPGQDSRPRHSIDLGSGIVSALQMHPKLCEGIAATEDGFIYYVSAEEVAPIVQSCMIDKESQLSPCGNDIFAMWQPDTASYVLRRSSDPEYRTFVPHEEAYLSFCGLSATSAILGFNSGALRIVNLESGVVISEDRAFYNQGVIAIKYVDNLLVALGTRGAILVRTIVQKDGNITSEGGKQIGSIDSQQVNLSLSSVSICKNVIGYLGREGRLECVDSSAKPVVIEQPQSHMYSMIGEGISNTNFLCVKENRVHVFEILQEKQIVEFKREFLLNGNVTFVNCGYVGTSHGDIFRICEKEIQPFTDIHALPVNLIATVGKHVFTASGNADLTMHNIMNENE